MVDRWERFLGFSWKDVEALEKRFRDGQVNTTIFFLRALPIFRCGDLRGGGFAALAAQAI